MAAPIPAASTPIEKRGTPTGIPLEDLAAIRGLYKTLGSPTALQMLIRLHDGDMSTDALFATSRVTKRRFYIHLNMLKRAGLISKVGPKTYGLSPLGSFVYAYESNIWRAIGQSDEFDLYMEIGNRLNGHSTPARYIKANTMFLKSLERSIGLANMEPIKVFRDQDSLTLELFQAFKGAKLHIDIATRIVEHRLITMKEAAERGVRVRILTDVSAEGFRINSFAKIAANPATFKAFRDFIKLPNVALRMGSVTYSFILVDGVDIGVEIPNPLSPQDFLFGMRFKSATMSEEYESKFEEMWSKASKDEFEDMIKRWRMNLE
ncbi:MAG: hypothetical protein JRN22_03585 [Nitrososphaerota archaeon]|nr:hypothetical protein [Nitrososphaerota archaeon]